MGEWIFLAIRVRRVNNVFYILYVKGLPWYLIILVIGLFFMRVSKTNVIVYIYICTTIIDTIQ